MQMQQRSHWKKTLSLAALAAFILAGCSHAVVPPAEAQISGGKLPTKWDAQVSPTSPLPDYPRPQMTRSQWQSLNGPWDYALTDSAATSAPAEYAGRILVPFCYESALSGVGKESPATQRLWYRRTFTVPAAWKGEHILLHFGAVNWNSTVSVNGQSLGGHMGGYDAFDYDITDALRPGDNTIVVSAWNPLRTDQADAQVAGKQRAHPGNIFYTAATGIWQTVWIEPVPAAHIASLKITPDIDAKTLHVTAQVEGAGDAQVKVTALDGKTSVANASGGADADIAVPIADPHLWSPDDPHLYDLKVTLTQNGEAVDSVGSYFAMRKISVGPDDHGTTRVLLNNKFVPEIGLLDQGYWPDGIYTAPTDEALKYDIQEAKSLGYNLLRKHAKVEPDRWYYWTDKLGMLVWQDMPQCFAAPDGSLTDDAKAQFLIEWKREMTTHHDHPSIVVWTTFNEGWGEHDVASIVALTKQMDPSRLVNDASGWTDMGVGDIRDTHAYPGPGSETAASQAPRAVVNGEFGGITMRVPSHMWTTDVFGYGSTLQSGRQVTQKYQALLKTAYHLMQADQNGTSAFVYTQLTDVEGESNGILTYDRAMVKGDVPLITAANKGQFLPLPPDPNPPLVPTSADTPQTWQYTTQKPADGWNAPGFDASPWKSGPAPFGQGYTVNTPWTDTPGDIWLRREVTLPDAIPAKLTVLALHDEDVEVYVNGVLAASAPGYVSDYASLPMSDAARAAMKPGKNLIAVHCHQTIGGQVIDVGIVNAAQ